MAAADAKPQMEYRFLGNSGLKVSVLSFGAWITWGNQITDDEAFASMKAAWDHGCNFFDNAEVYASGKAEITMGKCIKRLAVDRTELVITTKIFWGGANVNQRGLSRKHIVEGARASLKRLDLDYVDVIYAHRPDPATPMEEVVRAFNFLIDQGQAFYWGTSEWSAEQIVQAVYIAKELKLVAPIVEQPQYSMLHRTRVEAEYGRLYKEVGLGLTVWSPLAGGLLTGKYRKDKFPEDSRLGATENNSSYKWLRDQLVKGDGMNGLEEKNLETILEKVEGLQPIIAKLGCTLAQLALAWCIKNPNISTVITGASKASQVVENFQSLAIAAKLTPHILEEIEKVLANKPKQPATFR